MDQIVKSNGDTIDIYEHGTVLFYKLEGAHDCYNVYTHRLRGPARILKNGQVTYYVDNEVHRTDGPAYILLNNKQYFVNNIQLSPDEYFLKYGVL